MLLKLEPIKEQAPRELAAPDSEGRERIKEAAFLTASRLC